MVAVREGPEYGSNNEERKVRAPQGKVLGNTQSRQREGKCHRKYTAPHFHRKCGVRVKR